VSDEIDKVINNDEDDRTVLIKNPEKALETSAVESSVNEDATRLVIGKRRSVINGSPEILEQTEDDSTQLISDVENLTDATGSRTGTSLIDAINRTNQEVIGLKNKHSQIKIINQRFLLASKLGVGGMGAVYRAKDLRKVEAQDKNPWVAVKLLNEAFKEHPTAFIALQREAQKSQKLAHPNIVRVYDFDRDGETVYMTMELLRGEDLNFIIKRNKQGLEREEALSIIRQVGGALAEAHKHNIVHSDFKPGNIFYTEDKNAKIFDFGIARAVSEIGSSNIESIDANEDNDNTIFDASTLNALTPAYASKEMHEGEEACKSDDVYALGCVAYEVLIGRHPYEKTPSNKINTKEYKLPIVEGLKRKQQRALQKSIAIERQDRYQSVDEFLNDFLPERNKIGSTAKLMLIVLMLALISTAALYYNQQDSIKMKELALFEEQKKIDKEKRAVELQIEQEKKRIEEALTREKLIKDLSELLDGAAFNRNQKSNQIKASLDNQIFQSSLAGQEAWQKEISKNLKSLIAIYNDTSWVSAVYEEYPEGYQKMYIEDAEGKFKSNQNVNLEWASAFKKKLSKIYVIAANEKIKKDDYLTAEDIISLAKQYDSENQEISNAELALLSRKKERALSDRKLVKAEKLRSFEIYNNTAKQHVDSCTNYLVGNGEFGYNMKTLQVKLTNLKRNYQTLKGRVKKANAGHVQTLGQCIRMFGESSPREAKEVLIKAKKLFPSYLSELEKVDIRPFNSCNPIFAGKGRRYNCSDRFLDNLRMTGPKLVVIRTKSSGLYAIGKYEITRGEMYLFCKSTGACELPKQNEFTLPATGYSAETVEKYVAWLSQNTGFQYGIPSKFEWQFAATARSTALDNNRNCQLDSRGILKGSRLLPIDIGKENNWGLINHVGNAEEIIRDGDSYRLAGGSRQTPMESCSIQAIRGYDINDLMVAGFRVVRQLTN